MAQSRCQAAFIVADALTGSEATLIGNLAAKHRLPSMHQLGQEAEAGGLMSYGPNMTDQFRRAAAYVDKILKGAKPADLPVEQPTKFELLINLKTARALGLTIPPTLLVLASEVIE
jgi:putative tryptophan/tyrosine transport system substrate-binding protein